MWGTGHLILHLFSHSCLDNTYMGIFLRKLYLRWKPVPKITALTVSFGATASYFLANGALPLIRLTSSKKVIDENVLFWIRSRQRIYSSRRISFLSMWKQKIRPMFNWSHLKILETGEGRTPSYRPIFSLVKERRALAVQFTIII